MLIRLIFFNLCSCHFLAFLHSLLLFVLHLVRAELIGKRNAKPAQGVYDEQEGDGEHQEEEWGEITWYTERVTIKCTELFHVDGELTKADEIPEEIRDAISDAIVSEEQGAAYTEWWENYQEQADLEINPMPEDVPYNVDMNLATVGSGSAE